MKKTLLLVLVLGLVLPAQSANAQASCKSVKSQVLKLEKKITTNLNWIKSQPFFTTTFMSLVTKNYYFERSSVEYARLNEIETELIKSLNALWKLGFNNPKCFTNTQKLWINDRYFKAWYNYVEDELFDTVGTEPTKLSDQEFMSRHRVVSVNNYKSIYKY